MSLQTLINKIQTEPYTFRDLLKLCEAAEVMREALEHYEDIPIWKVAGIDTSGPEIEEVENEEFIALDAISKADQICAEVKSE